MSDPFKLVGKLMLLCFKVVGYSVACGFQALWYIAHGKREMVGSAVGYWGRDVTNAIAEVFRR